MRCGGGLAAAWISVTQNGGSCAAADARVEVGSCGASGRVYKGAESGGGGIARANRARLLRSARVRLGLEVGDGSDHWAPPGSDAESGAALSAAEARREEARGCWACAEWAACWRWAAARKKRGGEENLFHFLNSSFAQFF